MSCGAAAVNVAHVGNPSLLYSRRGQQRTMNAYLKPYWARRTVHCMRMPRVSWLPCSLSTGLTYMQFYHRIASQSIFNHLLFYCNYCNIRPTNMGGSKSCLWVITGVWVVAYMHPPATPTTSLVGGSGKSWTLLHNRQSVVAGNLHINFQTCRKFIRPATLSLQMPSVILSTPVGLYAPDYDGH